MIYFLALVLCAVHLEVHGNENEIQGRGGKAILTYLNKSEVSDVSPMLYYWRSYMGSIPADAVSAGVDADGTPVYVGQVAASMNNNHGLIPGAIRTTSSFTYVTLGEGDSFGSNGNVQILCSPTTNRFQWIITSTNNFPSIVNSEQLLVSGYEFDGESNGYALFIGRSAQGNQRVVGKIRNTYVGNHVLGRLYYNYNNSEFFSDYYEILTFV